VVMVKANESGLMSNWLQPNENTAVLLPCNNLDFDPFIVFQTNRRIAQRRQLLIDDSLHGGVFVSHRQGIEPSRISHTNGSKQLPSSRSPLGTPPNKPITASPNAGSNATEPVVISNAEVFICGAANGLPTVSKAFNTSSRRW